MNRRIRSIQPELLYEVHYPTSSAIFLNRYSFMLDDIFFIFLVLLSAIKRNDQLANLVVYIIQYFKL